MSAVFHRGSGEVVAVEAEGCWITDSVGRRYLDAAGGAIVNGVGHGRREVIEAINTQLRSVDYVHGTVFTTDVMERYGHELAKVVPITNPRVFPVSGGSEAVETALKLARTFYIGRGEPSREVVIARQGSYHGNTLGALDASGKLSVRESYEPWLGRVRHVPAVNEFRCPNPSHPFACGQWHAGELDRTIREIGPERVAAFIAESIGGATLGAAVASDDYWPAVAEVCRTHGVLLVVDEVMAGFGRTGKWFGIDHWGVRPDIIVCAKGAASGYWPLGLCIASHDVYESAAPVFGHGFTFSHHPAGAAAGLAVLEILREESLVERSAVAGRKLRGALSELDSGIIGDVRGIGLMIGVEFVAEKATGRPFGRSQRLAERIRSNAFGNGLLVYPVTGCADGTDGDGLMVGPPLVVGDDELDQIVSRLGDTLTRF